MDEWIKKIGEAMRHNRFAAIAVIVAACILVWMGGCESTTTSPISQQEVTRPQLVAEADKFAADLALAYADLDRQDAFKQQVAELGVAVAQGGEVNPVGAALSLLGILGIGIAVDNRVKDSVIKSKTNALNTVNGGNTTTA
ncbi:MAG: hypothetical protein ACFFFO_17705 [Candidatus Thorarchaeota archaeon]